MQLIQTVAPLAEPLSLVEVKAFLRILDDTDDLLLGTLITAIRSHVENITNRQLGSATFELYDRLLINTLPKNPITSIEKIEYMDSDYNYVEMDTSNYYLFEKNGVGHIKYDEFPSLEDHEKAVKVTFVSGYDTTPEVIKQYMKVKIATLYENREEFVIGANIASFGGDFIENLLSSYKIRSI